MNIGHTRLPGSQKAQKFISASYVSIWCHTTEEAATCRTEGSHEGSATPWQDYMATEMMERAKEDEER